jgi:hypothetical protein
MKIGEKTEQADVKIRYEKSENCRAQFPLFVKSMIFSLLVQMFSSEQIR